jgi:hypothetical protein
MIHLEPGKHAGPINSLGTIAMCFILFSGGLGTSFHAIRPVIRSGVTLATLGVVLTAFFLGVCGYLICLAFQHETSFAWWMLMASIISSTDAAAMFAILRGNGVNLSGDLQPLLELESGSNDPMAALLTLVMLQIVTASSGFLPELDLRGQLTDDAWFMTDKYIDDAMMANIRSVRIIHGKGTGALRSYLWSWFKGDSRIASFRLGAHGEGDSGVTILELK